MAHRVVGLLGRPGVEEDSTTPIAGAAGAALYAKALVEKQRRQGAGGSG